MSIIEFISRAVQNPMLLVASVLTLGVILVNGWTDAPNAIATCVSTKAIGVRKAIVMAAVFNFFGVLVMTSLNHSVAMTIYNMVDFGGDAHLSLIALCAAMAAIVIWATAAWYFGIPTSESHALIAGLSVSTHNLKFDYAKLPEIIQETMSPGMKVRHIKYTNISLNFGYAYNWVFARNCLACLSLSPAVAYKTSRIEKDTEEPSDWYKNFNIDFILRAGVVYNNSKYFVGTSFLGRTYDYYRDNFSLNNGFGTLQIYAGFNFYLKKEHRKKK